MRRISFVVVVAATGCGLELGDDPAVQVHSTSTALTGVCAQTRTAIGPVLATGELAATRTGTGLYAAWTGTVSKPASIVQLDAQFRVLARWDLGEGGPNLNGVVDLGTHVLAAYGQNSFGVVDMMQFTSDLSIWNYHATYAGSPARQPFLSNPTGTERAYLWSFGKTLIASSMDPSTGYAGGGSMFDLTSTITELSGDNGLLISGDDAVKDSAVTWVEDLGGGASRCLAGNIGFDTPGSPSLRATRVVSSDCRHARIAAGPKDDIQAAVTSTAGGVVKAHLRRGGADVVHVLSTSGGAAKVRFDGTRFWIAWRDSGVSNLRIASLDLIGNLVRSTTPGPQVAGDEAFDLVRTSSSTTTLVALAPDALEFVTLCR
jgi:hypothetical protein